MKPWMKWSAIALSTVLVAIQLVPVERTNPPTNPGTKPLDAPPEVVAVLHRSCYDCHSNETHWPWYAYVAPVSWLVAGDVKDGRAKLNFSVWGDYPSAKRASKAGSMLDEIDQGSMPLPKYVRIHADAKLSDADIAVLRKWADSFD
jgi:Haem-binding domain